MTNPRAHIPVMLPDVLAALAPRAHEIYVDGTFGLGGYTRGIMNAAAAARVIAFDRDPAARAHFDALDPTIKNGVTFVDAPFSHMVHELTRLGIAAVDGVVLDLGVSSPQLDQAERGFSFRFDGPLDMRMDPRTGQSAADVVNTTSETDLANILYEYGEERQSRRIARAVVAARTETPIQTTGQLADIIRRTIKVSGKDKSDPATRSFQALRIFVNRELDELRAVLTAALQVLRAGGRLIVVTFHSLEDRIVKQFFRDHAGLAPTGSRHAPVTTRPASLLNLPYKSATLPSAEEVQTNPRARSAKLRVAIRTDAPFDGRAA